VTDVTTLFRSADASGAVGVQNAFWRNGGQKLDRVIIMPPWWMKRARPYDSKRV